MTPYVALLRAVNVAGHQTVGMADLRAMLGHLGFSGIHSVLQSGNLVFRASGGTGPLERLLEREARRRLDLDTDFLVRTAAQWKARVTGNPFPTEAKRDPSRLLFVCLKRAPGATAVRALQAVIAGPERVRVAGAHAYIVYPDGVGRSRLTLPLIEKHFGTRGTARNWNTVLKLAALVTG
jgi:uncharacterized protein (DUF1697 family)